MISCRLYGRLGNQAFQIAACVGAAMSMGVKYIIPHETINPSVWPAYFADCFPEVKNPTWKKDFRDFMIWKEPSHAYTKIPDWGNKLCYNGVMLDGYFQSIKYFKKYIPQIRALFKMPIEMKRGTVAIHYRAGDFRNFPDKHPIVSVDYIYTSICRFERMGYKNFLVFSDEPNTIRDILEVFKGLNIKYSEGKTPMEDFKLMSSCEHGIVSNSSFSIMAQILNPNPNKIIIRPNFFFGPGNGHLDTRDVYPENWIKI